MPPLPLHRTRFVGDARATGRTLGFIGLTTTLLAGFELARLRAPPAERRALTHAWMQRYGRALLKLYGLEVRVEGLHVEHGGRYPTRDARGRGRVFVMNHRSMLDIFVDVAFVEAHRLSRADLATWPVIGLAARRVGTIFVERTDRTSGAAAITAMASALADGRGVLVYPEGTTFVGDEVRPFRAGAFAAAVRAGAEVVPLGIAYDGEHASFGDETFGSHYRRVAGEPTIRVGFATGEPLPPSDDVAALTARAHEAVQERVNRARQLVSMAAAAERVRGR